MLLQSESLSKIAGIEHGFGTMDEPLPPSFKARWEVSRPYWKQVHGIGIAEVSLTKQECGEVDSLISARAATPIGIITADCVPILMASKDASWVAAIHAGWRGTLAQILRETWKHLKAKGQKPSNWVAAIGPSIHSCCYEVSEDLANQFTTQFSYLGKETVVPTYRKLDLQRINEGELKEIGVETVEILPFCTFCSTHPKFNSFRRDAGKGRQYSVIQRRS